jgi:corrinoid protein of di/trimethylamine methyltransferase
MKQEILKRLCDTIVDCDVDKAAAVAQEALDAGIPALEAIQNGAAKGLDIIGNRFSTGEAYLPELILAGDAMKAVFEVLNKALESEDAGSQANLGKVVIGTVSGDLHDIGKNIVGAMLGINGFQVYDIGIDVAPKEFVKRAQELGANIIASSTLLTTSMPYQQDIVQYLEDSGLRDKFYYIVGGGPVTAEWTMQIKADGHGYTATDAIEVCKRLVKSGKTPGTFDPVILEYYQSKEEN